MRLNTKNTDESGKSRTRRPIDFHSRGVKFRIFCLLAMLMLVLFFAEKARDPLLWRFFAQDNPASTPPAPEFDGRLTPQRERTEGAPPGTFVSSVEKEAPLPQESVVKPPADDADATLRDNVARVWQDRWRDIWAKLSQDDRSVLVHALAAGSDAARLPPGERPAAKKLLAQIDTLFEGFHSEAFNAVTKLPNNEQANWMAALKEVHDRWFKTVQPALEQLLAEQPLDQRSLPALENVLANLQLLNLRRVQDNTPLMRFEERHVWYYWMRLLAGQSLEDLAKQSPEEVNYVQLFRGPEEYRGKLVKLRGSVQAAYYRRVDTNLWGTRQIFVYWIWPEGSRDTPVVVYALESPPGFPPLNDYDRDQGMTALNEPVSITGFFLKRGAYAAKHDSYTAPLILARVPQWFPSKSATPADRSLSSRQLWILLGISLATAACLAVVAYWNVFRGSPRPLTHDDKTKAQLQALADQPAPPSIYDVLKKMEEDSPAE